MRVYLVVLDGLGVGAADDCEAFGDSPEVSTLQHALGDTDPSTLYPTLYRLGLFSLKSGAPGFYRGILSEVSAAKDTITGHHEMMDIVTKVPPPTFSSTIPEDLILHIQNVLQVPTLCNKRASGTEIITELGERHLETGYPIVYTSADSVLQIASHHSVWSEEELHANCLKLRKTLLNGPYAVGRIIARPFAGDAKEGFYRTKGRHDYALPTPENNTLTHLLKQQIPVIAVGKIADMFTVPFTACYPGANNTECMESMTRIHSLHQHGLVFVNFVDFDTLCGHRRDPACFRKKLLELDRFFATFLPQLAEDDLLILTADHGCDPKAAGTDHTREKVPCLFYQKGIEEGHKETFLGEHKGFYLIGRTIEQYFLRKEYISFLKEQKWIPQSNIK